MDNIDNNGQALKTIVNVVNTSNNKLPEYATEKSAGMDLMADLTKVNEKYVFGNYFLSGLDEEIPFIEIRPGGRALIPTGLHIQLPNEYEAQVRPRSGLALKYGITVLNTPGTIDEDYTGDIGVILINHGQWPFKIYQGDRIAQLVIKRYEQVKLNEVVSLEKTERGEGGFGHTGV